MPLRHRPSAAPETRTACEFEELYRQWFRPVVALCRRHLGPTGDAEAVAQDAFVRAWLSWDRFAPNRPFGPWVSTIARRLCINEGRARSNQEQRLGRVGPALVQPPTIDPQDEDSVPTDIIEQALAHVPVRDRRLLVLRDVDGWSYSQIARFEGVTTESVRGRLKRARAAFRRIYGELSGGVLGGVASVLRRALRGLDRWSAAWIGRWAGPELAALLAMVLVGGTSVGSAVPPPTPDGVGVQVATASPRPAGPGSAVALGAAPHPGALVRGAAVTPEGTPDDAAMTEGTDYQFTVSPAYEDDHTVFAAGRPADCVGVCSTLLKSADGGATWTRLPGLGRDNGRILLPPSFPRDRRIFSVSLTTLSVSEDDGATFRPLASIPGESAMSPLFSAGDPRILFGASALRPVPLVYRDTDGMVVPVDLPLPASARATGFAFAPSYAEDRRVLVAVQQTDKPQVDLATGHVDSYITSRVYSCTTSACTVALDLGGGTIPPTLVIDPHDAGRAYAWTGFTLDGSTDGGHSFRPLTRPGRRVQDALANLTASPDGSILATVITFEAAGRDLYSSTDGGQTWTFLDHDTANLNHLTALPDGALLDAGDAMAGRGIRCSTDGGRSWASACRR